MVPPCPLGARSLDDATLPARACEREDARTDEAAAAAATAAAAAAAAPIEDGLTVGASTDLTSSKPFSNALTRFSK